MQTTVSKKRGEGREGEGEIKRMKEREGRKRGREKEGKRKTEGERVKENAPQKKIEKGQWEGRGLQGW